MKIRISLFAVFFLLCSGLLAQEDTATIIGVVTDPSGALVPNATVKATNDSNNESFTVKTNAQGVYTIPYLQPGVYTVEFTAAGFTTVKRQQITLLVQQSLNLPIQLTVGQAATEVTVSGQQEILETADANRGLVFDPTQTQDLPLNGRQS